MKTKEGNLLTFGKRIQQLRKEHGWSQPEVAKKIGTSGAIVSRYELGQMTPSIAVARKLADVFAVTLDYLASEREIPNILKDREMLARLQNLDELPPEDKDRIIQFVDVMIRDVKTREAYKVVS